MTSQPLFISYSADSDPLPHPSLSLSVLSANWTTEVWCIAAVRVPPRYHSNRDCASRGNGVEAAVSMSVPAQVCLCCSIGTSCVCSEGLDRVTKADVTDLQLPVTLRVVAAAAVRYRPDSGFMRHCLHGNRQYDTKNKFY